MRRFALAVLLALAVTPARADRVRVYSIVGLDGGDRGDALAATMKSVSGVHDARFELYSSELRLVLADGLPDARIVQVVGSLGPWRAIPGAGHGRYLPPLSYPAALDVALLTNRGAAVGPLEKLRVRGKTTIFDFYADWCIACRPLDERLRAFAIRRRDVAIRKLNVARWDSPLARELGPRLTALPHLVVFTPRGERREFDGATWEQVAAEMGWR